MSRATIRQGIDRFDRFLVGKERVALIANHTSIDRFGVPTVRILREAGVRLTCLFSLEHGYFPVAQDMEAVGKEQRVIGVPVFSLYGDSPASLTPSTALFDQFDTVIYDVQDIGSRYYTYLQSLTLFMDTLAAEPRRLIVLDRINPINGTTIEGSPLQMRYASFVGRFPLPHRHGLTTGEAARWYYRWKGYSFPFEVVTIEGWRRDTFADGYHLPWVPTSPNMPTIETAILYPGACLVEGTNLSEGRGTAFPFHVVGSPGVDPFVLCERLTTLDLPGVTFLPLEFRPMFQKHTSKRCGGVYLAIVNRTTFRPLRTFIAVIQTFREMLGDEGFFRTKPYEFVSDIPAIDLLLGDERLIALFREKASLSEIDCYLGEAEDRWLADRQQWLLYP